MSINRSLSTELEPVNFTKISRHSSFFSMMKNAAETTVLHPTGTKFLDYARKINQGKWLEMDFHDPEAARHVYKACEEGFIDSDDLATAILLINAKNDFADGKNKAVINQYRFDDASGPYDYTQITYAKKTNIDAFKAQLARLHDHQRFYFEITLPHKLAMVFLLEGYIHNFDKPASSKLNNIMKAYIAAQPIDEARKTHLYNLIDKPRDEDSFRCHCGGCTVKADEFMQLLLELNLNLKEFLGARGGKEDKDKERCSIQFFSVLARLAEQHPSFELSTTYDATNPQSPLVSIIITTMSAFKSLTIAMHGDDATLPQYIVGKFPVSTIRECDEEIIDGQRYSRRPVELVYPGITADDKPHEYPANNFMITFHDLFHVWRNGSNPLKDFARCLRRTIHYEKGFYMSKRIWKLTDMDDSYGKEIREASDPFSKYSATENCMEVLMQDAFEPSKFLGADVYVGTKDHNLLLLVDWIKNKKKWDRVSHGINLKELFLNKNSKAKVVYELLYDLIMKDSEKFRELHSSTYYVIKYHFADIPDGDKLCDRVYKTDILRWNRNGGLYIQPQYTKDNKKIKLQDLVVIGLSAAIHFALEQYEKLNFVDVEIQNSGARKNLHAIIRVNGNTDDLRLKAVGSYRMSLFWVKRCFDKIKQVQDEQGIVVDTAIKLKS